MYILNQMLILIFHDFFVDIDFPVSLTQNDEVHSGRGYQSHYGMRLHFGLGKCEKVDRIEVRWIGGGVDVYQDIAVDQLVTLTEGGSKPSQR